MSRSESGGALALIAVALAASLGLVVAYLALGGAGYAPSPVQDPCAPREWRAPDGVEESAEQFTLSALDGAACELRVSRETLAVALASEDARLEFASEYGIDDPQLEAAVRAGLMRAIDDAEEADALSPLVAGAMREITTRLPVDEAIGLIEDARDAFSGGLPILG